MIFKRLHGAFYCRCWNIGSFVTKSSLLITSFVPTSLPLLFWDYRSTMKPGLAILQPWTAPRHRRHLSRALQGSSILGTSSGIRGHDRGMLLGFATPSFAPEKLELGGLGQKWALDRLESSELFPGPPTDLCLWHSPDVVMATGVGPLEWGRFVEEKGPLSAF